MSVLLRRNAQRNLLPKSHANASLSSRRNAYSFTTLRFVETRRHILGRVRITPQNPAPEHFGSKFDQNSLKIFKIMSSWGAMSPGCVFFWKKTKKVCFRSTWLVYSNGCLANKNRLRGIQIWWMRLQIWLPGWPSRQGLQLAPDLAKT